MLFYLFTAFKGFAMGIAEVIPGVSGGTIAFITGIYERLINVIKSISPELIKHWRKDGLRGLWTAIDGKFIFSLLTGMVIGIGIGVFAITYLLETYPLLVWSYFFGLIVISAWFVGKQIGAWSGQTIFMITLGGAAAYIITIAVPAEGNPALWFVFISGAVAVSALLLPGISGSFVLLLMGMYAHIMGSLKGFLETFALEHLTVLVVFAGGMFVGMIGFSRFISWTFKNYRDLTLAALTGFLIGSLNKIWPWQEVLITRTKHDGETSVVMTKSVLPSEFSQLTENFFYGNDPQILACVLLMVAGVLTVLLFELLAVKFNSK